MKRLVAAHPKHEYWVDICRTLQTKPGFAPRLRLDLARLQVTVGATDTPDQYVAAAELALEQGFPGDAKTFLDKGYASGILGNGVGAERQKRFADAAKRQSNEDVIGLGAQSKEAEASGNANALEKLGEAYASYGRYGDAAAALESSIRKRSLEHPDDARLHLGVTYLEGSQPEKAKQVLNTLTAQDGTQDLAQLWLIHAGAR
jgi:tetratricopeptide (TPR) repeat protein